MPIMGLVTELEAGFDYDRNGTCPSKIGNATSCFECCQNRYFNGNGINYDCVQFRKAYIMRYLPVHIHENYLALCRIPHDVIDEIGQNETVNMLSLGGGPGTDIAAFKKYIQSGFFDDRTTRSFRIVRIEREDNWNGFARRVIHLFACENFEIDHRKRHQSVLEMIREEGVHVVTLSYILSEIELGNIPDLTRNIARTLAETAVIIVNDRDEDEVREKAELLLESLQVGNFDSRNDREWCGVYYPGDIRDRINPKLKTNSIRYTAVKR